MVGRVLFLLVIIRVTVGEHDDCPLWYVTPANSTNLCSECWPNTDQVRCIGSVAYIEMDYIMTTRNDSFPLLIAKVQFQLNRVKKLRRHQNLYRELPSSNFSDVNTFFCEEDKRKGYFCADCQENCGIALYTYYSLPCACPCHNYGIPLYLLLEVGFSSLFFALIVAFKCSVHSGKWITFVFYFQLIANYVSTSPYVFTTFTQSGHYIPSLLLTLYGIWNMDYLRLVVPRFCVSSHIGVLGAISCGYIAALWPLVLILLISLAIRLHNHNIKVVLCSWKLANKIILSSGWIQRQFADTNLIHTFATFFILSYLKMVYTSCALLGATVPFGITSKDATSLSNHRWLSFDPNISYLSPQHILYAGPAVIILVLVGILFPVVLLVYPTRYGTRLCGGDRTGRFLNSVRTFIEALQGSYKDGTNGTRDYRAISGLYLLMRVFIGLVYAFVTTNKTYSFLIIAGLCLAIVAFFGLAKPMKTARHNLIEVFLYSLIAIQCIYLYVIYNNSSSFTYEHSVVHTSVVLTFLPMIVAVIIILKPCTTRVVWQLVRRNKTLILN